MPCELQPRAALADSQPLLFTLCTFIGSLYFHSLVIYIALLLYIFIIIYIYITLFLFLLSLSYYLWNLLLFIFHYFFIILSFYFLLLLSLFLFIIFYLIPPFLYHFVFVWYYHFCSLVFLSLLQSPFCCCFSQILQLLIVVAQFPPSLPCLCLPCLWFYCPYSAFIFYYFHSFFIFIFYFLFLLFPFIFCCCHCPSQTLSPLFCWSCLWFNPIYVHLLIGPTMVVGDFAIARGFHLLFVWYYGYACIWRLMSLSQVMFLLLLPLLVGSPGSHPVQRTRRNLLAFLYLFFYIYFLYLFFYIFIYLYIFIFIYFIYFYIYFSFYFICIVCLHPHFTVIDSQQPAP